MGRTIGIGITGGIAAYKIADLVSRLKKDRLEVAVIMTEAAARFITPLTLRTLSGREVITNLWGGPGQHRVRHIGLAEALDLLVIAPATANFIAKMAHGLADDALSTLVLANTAPVLVVPSMNNHMYDNPRVRQNIAALQEQGYSVMDPYCGALAFGTVGQGRLPEIADIYQEIKRLLKHEPAMP